MARTSSASRRVHVVLIPGFAGFDALGQMEYYTGLTPHFTSWRQAAVKADFPVVLHYFDNFPTAAVHTRAIRLRNYLAKRIARGEFLPGDEVALVGHSTGGLDIRRLLWNLHEDAALRNRYFVDGARGESSGVDAGQILRLIKRVVFLSVPQWGTNIADWVRSYRIGRELVVAQLRCSVLKSQIPIIDRLQGWFANWAATIANLGLGYAIRDALSEAEADRSSDPYRIAMAQEAAAELELWLRHMATDFAAIDDLAANPDGDRTSPAHFSPEMREREVENWKARGIQTRSYATIGTRPYRLHHGKPAPVWSLLNPCTYPDFTKRTPQSEGTDITYRYAYRACAGGPFAYPAAGSVPQPHPFGVDKEMLPIELWDNDGIVNTRSMLWPDGAETLLVKADHMDIVGHFRLLPADGNSGRDFDAYDLLGSQSGFDEELFKRVWSDVFDFCTSAETLGPRRERRAPARRVRTSRLRVQLA